MKKIQTKAQKNKDRTYETKNVSVIGGKRLAHQISESGWSSLLHRIALLDEDGNVLDAGSSSVYQHPAFAALDGEIYIATTQYFEGEPIACEAVHRIAKNEDEKTSVPKTFDERVDALMRSAPKPDIVMALAMVQMVRQYKKIGSKKDFAAAFLKLKDRLDDDYLAIFNT